MVNELNLGPMINQDDGYQVTPLWCGAAGSCGVGAVGASSSTYNSDSALTRETNGTWSSGFEPTGDAALNG